MEIKIDKVKQKLEMAHRQRQIIIQRIIEAAQDRAERKAITDRIPKDVRETGEPQGKYVDYVPEFVKIEEVDPLRAQIEADYANKINRPEDGEESEDVENMYVDEDGEGRVEGMVEEPEVEPIEESIEVVKTPEETVVVPTENK